MAVKTDGFVSCEYSHDLHIHLSTAYIVGMLPVMIMTLRCDVIEGHFR